MYRLENESRIEGRNNMSYNFDAAKEKEHIIEWIRKWFEENGPSANAVVGISGGKDSTIVAALLAEALGKERVYGVLMRYRRLKACC